MLPGTRSSKLHDSQCDLLVRVESKETLMPVMLPAFSSQLVQSNFDKIDAGVQPIEPV